MQFNPYQDSEKVVLGNGLEIYNYQWPYPVSWHRIGLVIHTGSAQDPSDELGLAHFAEHMLAGSMDLQEMNKFFDSNGGHINLGSTGFFHITYDYKIQNEPDKILQSLGYLSKMIFNKELKVSNFEKQKKVIISEFVSKYPSFYSFEAKLREHSFVYPNTFLEKNICSLGNLCSIKNMKFSSINHFLHKYIVPSNMTLVSVGNLSMEHLLKMINTTDFIKHSNYRTTRIRVPINSGRINPISNLSERTISDYKEFVRVFDYYSIGTIPNTIDYRVVCLFTQLLLCELNQLFRNEMDLAYAMNASCLNYKSFSIIKIRGNGIDISCLDKVHDFVEKCIKNSCNFQKYYALKTCELKKLETLDYNGDDFIHKVMEDLIFYNKVYDNLDKFHFLRDSTYNLIEEITELFQYKRRWTLIQKG